MKNRVLSLALALALAAAVPVGSYVASADGENVSEFFNDFEEYETEIEWLPTYSSSDSNALVYFAKEFTGNAGITNYAFKADCTSPFKDDRVETPKAGDQYPRPKSYTHEQASTYFYKNIDRGKYVPGGLPGYIGFNSFNGFPLWYGTSYRWSKEQNRDLVVMNNGGNNELVLNPMKFMARPEQSISVFGKENVQIVGRKTLTNLNVRIDNETNASGFRLHILKNPCFEEYTGYLDYDWMNYCNQFYNRQNMEWLDVVTFLNGKVYIGWDIGTVNALSDDAYVCDYEVGRNYKVEYYLNLEELSDPRHMVCIYDEDGSLVGRKSQKIVINAKSNTNLNNPDFWGSTMTKSKMPTNVSFSKFDDESSYGVFVSYSTNIANVTMNDSVAAIDNFGLQTSPIDSLQIVTDEDYYVKNPIAFLGEQSGEITFNVDVIGDIKDYITVKDSSGNTMDCTVESDDNSTVRFTFPEGSLAASSNYYVNISKDAPSAFGSLPADKVLTVRTKDVINVDSCKLLGSTLETAVSNNSEDECRMLVVAAVRKDGKLSGNSLYYRTVYLKPGSTAKCTVEAMDVPAGAEVEVFYLDSFGKLRAFCNSVIAG
mgnify:CR=1 FL=1